MTLRNRESTVTFAYPFSVGDMDRPQPAGTYRVISDEEDVPDVSFHAVRRVATYLHTPALETPGRRAEVFAVSPAALEAALSHDRHRAQAVAAERGDL
jgi:hypothetical protein